MQGGGKPAHGGGDGGEGRARPLCLKYSHPVREGPEFVLWFVKWGTAGVLLIVAISVGLFWLLKRWSDRKTAEHDEAQKEKAGAPRRP